MRVSHLHRMGVSVSELLRVCEDAVNVKAKQKQTPHIYLHKHTWYADSPASGEKAESSSLMDACVHLWAWHLKKKRSHIWNLSQQHLLCFLRTLLAFVSRTFKQAHIHIFMRMLNNLGNLPRRTIMRGSVWVDFCLTELFPVELYFYSVLKASCSTCHTDSQRSVCSPRTLNEVMAKTVEPMTCE